MTFTPKFFNPLAAGGVAVGEAGAVRFKAGGRPQDTYVYGPKIVLAVNVALATGRPLFISGEPGSGKTMLASNVAAVLGWWSYQETVTSRTTSSDLLWTFDALGRLNDATMPKRDLKPDHYYVQPRGLWWAFDPATAVDRGKKAILEEDRRAVNPGTAPAPRDERDTHDDKAVILLDEVDKADPDVPNDLLEPLDVRRFTVRQTGHEIEAARQVLVIMTTNDERELPPAFLRRCVSLSLPDPDREWFVSIADQRYGAGDHALHVAVAKEVMRHREAARNQGLREPSTAEYLDALEACRKFEITPESQVWKDVAAATLWKHEVAAELAEAQPAEAVDEAAGAGDEGEENGG